jgi:hypothetical protein
MSGIGGQEEQGKIITSQIPLPDTVDGVIDALREIILKGSVTGISVKNGEPIIYERYLAPGAESSPEDDTHGFTELNPIDVLRNVDMDEFDEADYGMEHLDGPGRLMWMFLLLEGQGYSVTHIVLSTDSAFWPWIGIAPAARNTMERFLGARVVLEEAIPSNAFLLCGSPHRGATVAEIKFALKGNVPGEKNEGTDQEGR